MRVSFSCLLEKKSGKQNFAVRLANELENNGVKITDKKPDINLVFVKGFRKKCKNILRLDGVWMNTNKDYSKRNRIIQNSIKSADGIVYQNEFCKQTVHKFFGKNNKPETVILNGANPGDFNQSQFRERPYFLALCRWRPHKRLRDAIEGFLYASFSSHDFVVCGDADYKKKDKKIIYLGHKNISYVEKILSGCVGTVHLAYLDWCPNSVVESLVAGKPVLCTTSGGTSSIVKNNGVCLKDKEWDFKPLDLYSPPKLNLTDVADGYHKLLSIPPFKRPDLYIQTIAKQYINFMKQILNYGR